jgi:hypothetical protein
VRYQAMSSYYQAGGDGGLVYAAATDASPAGQYVFDYVYDAWYHKVRQQVDQWNRQEAFFHALQGVVRMHQQLLTGRGSVPLDMAPFYRALRLAAAVPKELNALIAQGLDAKNSTVRQPLLATDNAMKDAYLVNQALWAVFAVQALAADAEVLTRQPDGGRRGSYLNHRGHQSIYDRSRP